MCATKTTPRPSLEKCPLCNSETEIDCATSTYADHNGEPVETTSREQLYCLNKDCDHGTEPIDNEDAFETENDINY